MRLYTSRSASDAAAERLKIYAQPQRLMILSRLIEGEQTVSQIDEATGIGQPALSQQLAELRRSNIVLARRSSKQVYYRIADETVQVCVRAIEAMFGGGDPAFATTLGEALQSGEASTPPRPARSAAVFAVVAPPAASRRTDT